MRYKVPQNIDIQDRIIGPLTMLQLVYAVVGGGLAYSILITLPSPASYILAAPIALFTVAVIFVKVNERPFLNFFFAMIQFMTSPKQRVWHHGAVDNLKVVIYKTQKAERKIETKHISKEQIERAAERFDSSINQKG